MATKYTETEAEIGDRSRVLDTLCEGDGWIFVQVTLNGADLGMKLEIGGIMGDTDDVRILLTKLLDSLPS